MDAALATKDILVAAGIGAFGTQDDFAIYLGAPPDKPDAVVVVNMTGGLPPHPRLALNYPSVQLMVRGKRGGYLAASAKIQEAVNALLGLSTATISGDTYRACNQLSDIAFLGQDDSTRPILSANFRFIVEPALMAGGHRVSIS